MCSIQISRDLDQERREPIIGMSRGTQPFAVPTSTIFLLKWYYFVLGLRKFDNLTQLSGLDILPKPRTDAVPTRTTSLVHPSPSGPNMPPGITERHKMPRISEVFPQSLEVPSATPHEGQVLDYWAHLAMYARLPMLFICMTVVMEDMPFMTKLLSCVLIWNP